MKFRSFLYMSVVHSREPQSNRFYEILSTYHNYVSFSEFNNNDVQRTVVLLLVTIAE